MSNAGAAANYSAGMGTLRRASLTAAECRELSALLDAIIEGG